MEIGGLAQMRFADAAVVDDQLHEARVCIEVIGRASCDAASAAAGDGELAQPAQRGVAPS